MLMNQNELKRKIFKQPPIFICITNIKCILFTTLISRLYTCQLGGRYTRAKMLSRGGIFNLE